MIPAGFVWKDHSRYVEIHSVGMGWLVLWGHYEDAGARKVLAGQRTYTGLDGARHRLADAVLALTRRPDAVAEALTRFDHFPFPDHAPSPLPAAL